MERNHSLHYLCDTPQILRDMEYIKGNTFGNTAKGSPANKMVNIWARKLQADWMITRVPIAEDEGDKKDDEGNIIEKPTMLNLHTIRSIGYIREAIAWNPDDNFDRVSAMGMCMILREDRLKFISVQREDAHKNILNDPWFNRFAKFPKQDKYRMSKNTGFML
jgi:hypothetical protein